MRENHECFEMTLGIFLIFFVFCFNYIIIIIIIIINWVGPDPNIQVGSKRV